ncbi:MAG: DUF456 domain-containing protein [Planctomycetota bacterium]|jgi:uncharacterized protein YqgC (DUF456 family)
MDWLLYVVATLFFLLGAGCVVLVVLQLPGGWVMLGLAGLIEWLDRFYLTDAEPVTFGWLLLLIATALLGLGELIEFVAAALGAQQGGASRRGVVGSLVGGVAGAIVFTPFIPIPVVGTLVGAILGTFIGAIVGEVSGPAPTTTREAVKPAFAAGVGRVVGTMSKTGITLALWIVLTVAAFWP